MHNEIKDSGTKYLAVYAIWERQRIDDYVLYAIQRLRENVSDIVIISSEKLFCELAEKSNIKKENILDIQKPDILPVIRKRALMVNAGKILFSDDSYFGPFYDWKTVLDEMEEENMDAWCLFHSEFNFCTSGFWAIDKKLLKRVVFDSYGIYITGEIDYTYKAYSDYSERYDNTYDVTVFRCFELLKEGLPVLYKRAFTEHYLDLSVGSQAACAVEYIEKNTEYNTSWIYQSLLRDRNLRELFHQFHWNYVLPTQKEDGGVRRSAAVIISLFYEKSLYKNLSYLKQIPRGIDLYIIAKRKELSGLIRKYLSDKEIPYHIWIAKQNRGRDLSALLIEARKIFEIYEYVCFLHDKQTSGGADSDIVGDDFNDSLFENMIGRGNYIIRILRLFEENKCLGILAPPEVYHGTYFSIIGREWTNNYENVLELASRLSLKVKIEKDYPPYILATSFWCRTKALKKLMAYNWQYDDFPEEPLNMDGTLNHALERILMYVAQDAGYYSGIVQTEESAGLYITNIRRMLDGALSVCHNNNYFNRYSEIFGDQGSEILKFCKKPAKIYIYGAGGNSSRIADFLSYHKISFAGYLVSDGYRQKDYMGGKKIYELSEILCAGDKKDHIKVLVSVNKKLQKVIVPLLQDSGLREYLCI